MIRQGTDMGNLRTHATANWDGHAHTLDELFERWTKAVGIAERHNFQEPYDRQQQQAWDEYVQARREAAREVA